MAIDIRVLVRNEMTRLAKKIAQEGAKLDSLKDQLNTVEKVYALLGGKTTGRPGKPAGVRRRRFVNWGSVLKRLPDTFTINDVAKARSARGKSKLYLRQVVARWAKEGKTKRTDRGKYQKV
jgi:hypothetical protein